MPRGLDHIVHAVRDLDAAAALYARLGFTVGARNKHPWGTHNHIVQLPGFFIELLTLAEPDKLGDDGFSTMFAAFNRDFIARGDGLSLLILESQSAQDDEAAFRAAGIAASAVMHFEREGKRPDGTPVKVGFSLAFAADSGAPDIHFCICQQHYPENFWNPAFQQHANGVQGIAGVVFVADAPSQHREFLLSFTGAATARDDDGGFAIDLPRGDIAVMTPAGFTARFGQPAPDTARGARLAALRFAVRDVGAVRSTLEQAAVAFANAGGTLVVGPEVAMGAVLVFEASR
ncbi:MAG TPA: VOC family protein [Pseudolabrys sp.]|nr:VOC family protein [Pseudolabrys sp.]